MPSMLPVDAASTNSSFSLRQSFTKADALKKCGDWVDSQSCHMQRKDVDCKAKGKKRHEEECDFPVGDGDSDSAVSACGNKRKRKMVKLKDEQLNLQCEWRDCSYVTCNLDHFVRHVSLHIPHLDVKENEDEEGGSSLPLITHCFALRMFLAVMLTAIPLGWLSYIGGSGQE